MLFPVMNSRIHQNVINLQANIQPFSIDFFVRISKNLSKTERNKKIVNTCEYFEFVKLWLNFNNYFLVFVAELIRPELIFLSWKLFSYSSNKGPLPIIQNNWIFWYVFHLQIFGKMDSNLHQYVINYQVLYSCRNIFRHSI